MRYLLIGGSASVLHGVPRTTLDLDPAVDPDPANVRRTLRAVERLGLRAATDRADAILARGGVTATRDRGMDRLASSRGATFPRLGRGRVEVRLPWDPFPLRRKVRGPRRHPYALRGCIFSG